MAMAMEVLGLSPMGSASVPAMDAAKDDAAYRCGQLVMDVLRHVPRRGLHSAAL